MRRQDDRGPGHDVGPVSGKSFPVESKLVITDDDHYSFELVGKAPNGRLTKLIEIQYTRKKS